MLGARAAPKLTERSSNLVNNEVAKPRKPVTSSTFLFVEKNNYQRGKIGAPNTAALFIRSIITE